MEKSVSHALDVALENAKQSRGRRKASINIEESNQ